MKRDDFPELSSAPSDASHQRDTAFVDGMGAWTGVSVVLAFKAEFASVWPTQ